MTSVGARCNFLKASPELKSSLEAAGRRERFSPSHTLFREDDNNNGVYLLLKGKVKMSVKGLPKLDRLFSAGSVLGVPSTFTGHAYSLTAQAQAEVDAVHVPQDAFLHLMRERSDLCREATEMLGREVTFIQSALAERRKQAARNKISNVELGALVT
jgi:CRP-like cAMP-binding protein